MRQVGQKRRGASPAPALALADMRVPSRLPGRLPALRSRRHPALVSISRSWVLHKPIVLRAAIGFLVAALIAAAVQGRGGIMGGVEAVGGALSSHLASAGFGISAIDMSGQVLSSETSVARALAIGDQNSILSYDAEAARLRLLELPAISEASVRKVYPDRLIVTLTEKTPVARWTVDGITFLIDGKGERLGAVVQGSNRDLPLVIGAGAGNDALAMVRAIDLYPELQSGLMAISRIGDRRWDLLYDTGLRVAMPELGLAHALRELAALQSEYQLLDRDLSLIDMRVAGSIAVRVTERDEENS